MLSSPSFPAAQHTPRTALVVDYLRERVGSIVCIGVAAEAQIYDRRPAELLRDAEDVADPVSDVRVLKRRFDDHQLSLRGDAESPRPQRCRRRASRGRSGRETP